MGKDREHCDSRISPPLGRPEKMDAFGPRRRDPYPPHPPTPEPQTKQLLRPGGGRRGEKEKEGCLLSDLPFSVFRAPGSFLSYMEEQE